MRGLVFGLMGDNEVCTPAVEDHFHPSICLWSATEKNLHLKSSKLEEDRLAQD